MHPSIYGVSSLPLWVTATSIRVERLSRVTIPLAKLNSVDTAGFGSSLIEDTHPPQVIRSRLKVPGLCACRILLVEDIGYLHGSGARFLRIVLKSHRVDTLLGVWQPFPPQQWQFLPWG